MCLNSPASKHTCHGLNSEIGWDIRSDIFFFFFTSEFLLVPTERKRQKISPQLPQKGVCLIKKEFKIANP